MIEMIKDQLKRDQELYVTRLFLNELETIGKEILHWCKELKECEDDADKGHIIDGYAATMKELEKYFENKLA